MTSNCSESRKAKTMKSVLLASLVLLSWATPSAADVIAKNHTWSWNVSVERHGEPWKDDCKLALVGEGFQGRHQISLKQKGYYCALFGPVQILASDTEDRKTTYVFFEAARGGDGDHSSPIVEIFSLNRDGLRKLGEQKLNEASYKRKGETFISVVGNVIFSFCDVCAGGQSGDPEMDFTIPVRVTIGCGGICVTSTLNKTEKAALISKFEDRKIKELATPVTGERMREHVAWLEKAFREMLSR